MFNTSTLGYKLLSGKLRESRKHSEQLNKYVAGLIDADGSLSLNFAFYSGYYNTRLSMILVQSFSNDPDGELIRSIRDYYNLGTICYRTLEAENQSSQIMWMLGTKDTKILFNRIGKHLRIKGTHFDNLIWLVDQLRGVRIKEEHLLELRDYSKCSRKNSKWLKHPKHLSWAWVAGYLDGDGHYRCRIGRTRYNKTDDRFQESNELSVTVTCHQEDSHIVDFLKVCFKGHTRDSGEYKSWRRSLGVNNKSFSLPFLKKMRMYSCLYKKYKVIEMMIAFLEDPAETKQESLERGSDSPQLS